MKNNPVSALILSAMNFIAEIFIFNKSQTTFQTNPNNHPVYSCHSKRKDVCEMSKLADANEKLASKVTEGYRKIETGVVQGYKAIETGVVTGFEKVTDGCVKALFAKEGETVEEAKARLRGTSERE